ncbi:MAG: hypothetical protein IPM29_22315 [Planctomycetes bacterium]|nr:hypothetical protein [Planctomycetota bacterium]
MSSHGTSRSWAARTLVLLVGVPLAAQSTHIVGPGGFAQIDPAIQSAQPGDTVLITASGRFEHFTLDRGVTIRVDTGQVAYVSNAFPPIPYGTTRITVPAGQTAELIGIRFAPDIPLGGTWLRGRVRVLGGTVVFRDCWFEGEVDGCGGGVPALEIDSARVALQLCRVLGFDRYGYAVLARNSIVSAFDSTFRGGDGCWDSFAYGADGIRLVASSLHGSRLVVEGGSTPSLNPNYDGGHGIVVDATSRLWLADATVTGGAGGPRSGRGGDGIHNLSTRAVEATRLTVRGGPGSPPGVPTVGPIVDVPELCVAWATPTGPALGATWTLRFQVPPATPVAAIAALELAVATVPQLAEPLWLAPAPGPVVWASASADPQGDVSIAIAIPAFTALRGEQLWFQGAALRPGGPVQLSPLLGGQLW